MSTDREKIFTAIHQALDPLPERTPYPEWDSGLVICRAGQAFDTIREQFAEKLRATSARYCDSVQQVGDLLRTENSTVGYCDPDLLERFSELGDITFETEFDADRIDRYSFGITRASAAIAESGTIMLKDGVTSARLAALAPWIHIAVIDADDIVASLPEAIERFGDDPSIIWCTGPSKTADVEGILIEGVHGPGIQVGLVI